MSSLRYSSRVGVLLAVTALPVAAGAAFDDVSISGDASLNSAMRRYRQLPSEQVAWRNPHLPQASVSYVPSAAAEEIAASGPVGAGPTESADENLARIVAQYDRPMLDRGGWANALLPPVASGNPIVAVATGAGVTLSGTALEASAEEGAASGEPESSPAEAAQPKGK